MKCFFCDSDRIQETGRHHAPIVTDYRCPRCGNVYRTREAADDLPQEKWYRRYPESTRIVSICLRIESERRNGELLGDPLTLGDLIGMVKRYSPLDPLAKMDKALLTIMSQSKYIGYSFSVTENDYPLYHCYELAEMANLVNFLLEDELIATNPPKRAGWHHPIHITTRGYQRIKELQDRRLDSRQGFVAMWFAQEMMDVYEQAIKPAIEYKEAGETESRFKALHIASKEHNNDINDEIIAEIRRSKFMVCDLTGYRGGVYWEAGFAYGLGMEVIYTCRGDWVKESPFFLGGSEIKTLKDSAGNDVKIKKEGIHFDIEHRNRIQWKTNALNDFRTDLEKRIRASVI